MFLERLFVRAWATQPSWLYALMPLSLLYALVVKLRYYLYQQGWLSSYRPTVPVLIIGNITIGGSGKTPLIIALVKFLQQQGLRIAVISRGYGGQGPFPKRVLPTDDPGVVGDEPLLIVQQTGVPMAVGPDRQAAIELLLDQSLSPLHSGKPGCMPPHRPAFDLILSDDGLQHLALQRDLEWIVLDTDRGLGNRQLLPSGFLREPVSRLRTATVIEHGQTPQGRLHMHLKPAPLRPLYPDQTGRVPVAPARVHAVAGIGLPSRFFNTLRQLGFEVIEHAFADHHAYTVEDLNFSDALPIITTAKDAVKLAQLVPPRAGPANDAPAVDGTSPGIWVLPVEAVLSDAVYHTLQQQLIQLKVLATPAI